VNDFLFVIIELFSLALTDEALEGKGGYIKNHNCNSKKVTLHYSSTVNIVDSMRDLGVVIDSRLTMSDQVTALCWAGYYQLHQLRTVAPPLPEECAKKTSPGVHIEPPGLL